MATRFVPVSARWIKPGDQVGTDGQYLPCGMPNVIRTVTVATATEPDDRGLIVYTLDEDGDIHPKVWVTDVLLLAVPDRSDATEERQ